MKKFLLLALLLCGISQAWADTWTDGNGINWTFTVSGTNATDIKPTNVSSISGEIVIPETVGTNLTVTSIGYQAFSNCSGLTSVTIPEGVTSIGNYAFSGCSGLMSVTIPSSVTSIGQAAFSSCTGLTSVTIPEGVTSIGVAAFSGCSGLTSVTIPEGVTSIGAAAFQNCSGLTSVTIPEGVTDIGASTFEGCTGLTSVTIPEGVTDIGSYVFSGCSGLTSVTIPSSVTSIGSRAFLNCSDLAKVIVPDIAAWCGISFGGQNDNPLYYAHHLYSDENTEITDLVIPEGVTSIGKYAFNGCSSLMSVTIPSSMTSIGENAFSGCSDLAKVIVTDIAAWCGISFSNDLANPLYYAHHLYRDVKTEITNLVIPDEVTSIGSYAFRGCSGLTSVTFPEGVTSIGNDAFRACSGLTSVTIPSSVTNIGSYVFSGCSGLTSVTILDGVTSIGDYAFARCSGLTSVNSPSSVASLTIPSSVTSIGNYAFDHCSGLTSVTIPSNVTGIGDYAFTYCDNLQSVTFQEGVKSIGNKMFYHCPYDLSDVTFPSSLTSIGNDVFDWCYKVKSVKVSVPDLAAFCSNQIIGLVKSVIRLPVILVDCDGNEIKEYVVPDGVKGIGASAFYNTNLTSVTIPSSVTSIGNSAFGSCGKLELFKCYALDVPLTNANAFGLTNVSMATLAVPYAAMSDYQTTSPWSNFGTITCLTIVVTANSYDREYGDPNPEFEWTVEGMPLDGTPSVTCTADESSAPGVYDIVIEQGTVTNANVTYVNGTLTITKAPLTITAKSYTINEGDAMPTFEVEYDGFKNDETADDLTSQPTISCTATDTNTEGTYDIVVSGAASDNYDISYVAGKLTVVPTAAHITISSAGMATYCSPYDLDFTDVTGLKAYIITGYDRASTKVYAMRVFDVPAGTGLYLVGNAGNYDVPITSSNSYYINMLVGTLAQTRIEPTDGENTNLILAGTSPQNASFKPLSEGRNFGANKAYLQIPTSVLYNAANAVGIFFDDEVVDGIETVKHEMEQCDGDWYSIDGRKLDGKPTQKGIYIKNGKKAVFR